MPRFPARRVIAVLSSAATVFSQAAAWPDEGSFRWQMLAPPRGAAKTGFTQLNSRSTGVIFTNLLDEWSSAANRVLKNGSGVACGDFDRDGRPDIFFCSLTGDNALYRNLGEWKFEEVAFKAGVKLSNVVCRGAVFADVDGDDWLDLLVSTSGRGVQMLLNDQRGVFTNRTGVAGTESRLGCMTLAVADIDGNRTLDLYVTTYRTDDI